MWDRHRIGRPCSSQASTFQTGSCSNSRAAFAASGLVESAETLEDAYDSQREFVSLTISDREAILRALEDCPFGLAELRGVLTLEHAWRVDSGLVSHAASEA